MERTGNRVYGTVHLTQQGHVILAAIYEKLWTAWRADEFPYSGGPSKGRILEQGLRRYAGDLNIDVHRLLHGTEAPKEAPRA